MNGGIKFIRGSYENVNHIYLSPVFSVNIKKVHHCSQFNAHLINKTILSLFIDS